jgi:hypothetical protein
MGREALMKKMSLLAAVMISVTVILSCAKKESPSGSSGAPSDTTFTQTPTGSTFGTATQTATLTATNTFTSSYTSTFTATATASAQETSTATATGTAVDGRFRNGMYPDGGYAGNYGSEMEENYPEYNFGGCDSAAAGGASGSRWRTVMKFDVSAIPSNAVVTGVSLTIYCSSFYSGAPELEAYPVTLTAWAQGSSCNVAEPAPAASWNHPWATPGGDYNISRKLFGPVTPAAAGYVDLVFGDYSVVQEWVSNPASNLGFVLMGGDAIKKAYFFMNHSTIAYRPLLTVNYYTP